MLATSKIVLFPCHNHLQTSDTDDPTFWLSLERRACFLLSLHIVLTPHKFHNTVQFMFSVITCSFRRILYKVHMNTSSTWKRRSSLTLKDQWHSSAKVYSTSTSSLSSHCCRNQTRRVGTTIALVLKYFTFTSNVQNIVHKCSLLVQGVVRGYIEK